MDNIKIVSKPRTSKPLDDHEKPPVPLSIDLPA
jgi:hypothetical protein